MGRRLLLTCLGLVLSLGTGGCDPKNKKKPPIGVSALRFTIGGNPALEVRVTKEWILIGRRGVVKKSKGISGTVDKRADDAEERARLKLRTLPKWKLQRKGDQLVGIVAGNTARITINKSDQHLEMEGRIGSSKLRIKQTHYNLRISMDEMTLDFGMELSGSTGGDRIWMASDGCCRLSVSDSLLNRTNTLPELALLMFAMEMSTKDQVVDEKVHPGWDDALSDKPGTGNKK